MTNSIKLTFVNRSIDNSVASIVVFQKNIAIGSAETAIAWLVIENPGQGGSRSFTYNYDLMVGFSDSYGNFSPQQPAFPGEAFDVITNSHEKQMVISSSSANNPAQIKVRNRLVEGAINAYIYRNALLLCSKTSIPPYQQAVFAFNPTIWIGVNSTAIKQGGVMNLATLSDINTEISLLGIASADIVMFGESGFYTFALENIVLA